MNNIPPRSRVKYHKSCLFTCAISLVVITSCSISARFVGSRNPDAHHFTRSSPPFNCDARDPQVIVYNRIPKAGSSTLLNLLRILSSTNDFSLIQPTEYYNHTVARDAIFAALSSGKRAIVCSHFNFPELLYGKGEIAYINVMRNPIDRCISQYYYLRYGYRSSDPEEDRKLKSIVLDRFGDAPLEECLEKPWEELHSCFNCAGNSQTLAFCGREDGGCKDTPGDMLLQQSWENIESSYFVGLTEDMNGTAVVLERLFPLFFKGMAAMTAEMAPRKVSQTDDYYVIPSEHTRDIIAKWTAIDMKLYMQVVDRYNRLRTQCEW